jgi:hypothetical protein
MWQAVIKRSTATGVQNAPRQPLTGAQPDAATPGPAGEDAAAQQFEGVGSAPMGLHEERTETMSHDVPDLTTDHTLRALGADLMRALRR